MVTDWAKSYPYPNCPRLMISSIKNPVTKKEMWLSCPEKWWNPAMWWSERKLSPGRLRRLQRTERIAVKIKRAGGWIPLQQAPSPNPRWGNSNWQLYSQLHPTLDLCTRPFTEKELHILERSLKRNENPCVGRRDKTTDHWRMNLDAQLLEFYNNALNKEEVLDQWTQLFVVTVP